MKKIIQFALLFSAFSVFTCICNAQPAVGGYKKADVKEQSVVAAANFAIESRMSFKKSDSLKLVSIQSAETQIVAGRNYSLCLRVNNGKDRDVKAVVWLDPQQKLTLTDWSWEQCSELGIADAKAEAAANAVWEKNLSGVWDYGSDLNKFVIKGKSLQRVITGPGEASKDFEIKPGDIDFVGVLGDKVIKGTQFLYIGSEARVLCPGLTGVQVNAELTLSADGKTISILRDDPFFDFDVCQWTNAGRARVTETMVKK